MEYFVSTSFDQNLVKVETLMDIDVSAKNDNSSRD